MKSPVLIQDHFYLLPAKLLGVCIAVFPVADAEEDAITVDVSQGDTTTKGKETAKALEVVQIKDVGTFSRAQIETFKRVHNLMTCVQHSVDMHKWLTEKGIPSLPAEYHKIANDVARKNVLKDYRT
ncbi:hypothetical protein V7S43_013594 [Phytophthora oleae]|uniref:RxLR effector protein n=1 Tax=Phytophthora oleae TaxID=2107226 RepID=A0ABD3F6S7_9STRA